jgi:hypothetical protein
VNTTTDPITHIEACIRALARQEAYDLQWPARCGECFGAGGGWSSFDPSPTGSRAPASLGAGSMQDFDTCACVDTGNCPRCGKVLLGPKWRPLNIRLALSQRVHKLAAWLRYVDIPSLTRTLYWRMSAAFRARATPWTWARFHVAEKLWDRLAKDPGWRGLRRAHFLWQVCELLERGYEYSETPCYYCGWGWGQLSGDAREPRECECWIPNFEAEQDQVEDWLEQERMHRENIALSEDGATHLLVGLLGGPIPVRRLNLRLRGDRDAANEPDAA